jgi:hypothetical protein
MGALGNVGGLKGQEIAGRDGVVLQGGHQAGERPDREVREHAQQIRHGSSGHLKIICDRGFLFFLFSFSSVTFLFRVWRC